MSSNISFIVCSNGYGHLKRVLLIANALLIENSNLDINIYCKENLITFAKEEINFINTKRVYFDSSATSQEISRLIRDGVTKKKYQAWIEELNNHKKLRESHLVISDNHVLPLRCFENVLLLGSFLWHDVARIEDQERVEIIESEISLLKQIETSMICLEPMAMPGVLEQTNAITVPWMTLTQIDVSLNDLKRIHILFTGGGTGLINDKLAAVALELAAQNPNWSIYLDAKLFNLTRKSNNGQLNKFNFSQEEFALLDAIVCRPGVGILTDCAQYRIPVLAIGDEENQEIKHNTARVQEMGVGIGIDLIQQHPRITAETVMTLVNSKESLNKFRNQWRKQATGGAEVAALEILSYMSRT